MVDKEFLNDIEEQRAIDNIIKIAFEGRKRPLILKRYLVAAVAVAFIGIPTFGFTFPALAEHIPIIGGLFARVDLHELPWFENMANYAVIVGETKMSDGISITLNEAYFDGREIYLTYLVESEHVLDRSIEWYEYNLNQEFRVIVDGQEIPIGLSGIDRDNQTIMYWLDDNSFFFIVGIPLVEGSSPLLYEALSQSEVIEIISNFSHFGKRIGWLEDYPWFEIDTIAEGPWNFRIPVERTERVRIVVGQRMLLDNYEVGVSSVSVSSTRLTVDYSVHSGIDTIILAENQTSISHDDNWQDVEAIQTFSTSHWQVVDDLGTTLSQTDRIEESYTGTNAWGFIHFEEPHPDARSITITPIIYEWHVENVWDEEAQQMLYYKGELYRRIEFESIAVDLPQSKG